MPLKDLIKAKRKANLNRRKTREKREPVTAVDKQNVRSNLSDDGIKIDCLEIEPGVNIKQTDDSSRVVLKRLRQGKQANNLDEENRDGLNKCDNEHNNKYSVYSDIDLETNGGVNFLVNSEINLSSKNIRSRDNVTSRNTEEDSLIKKDARGKGNEYAKPQENKLKKKILQTRKKFQAYAHKSVKKDDLIDQKKNDSENFENSQEIVKHRKTVSQNSCYAVSDRLDWQNTSSDTYFDDTPYVPSWLTNKENMDRERSKTMKTQKYYKSLSDIRKDDTIDKQSKSHQSRQIKPLHEDVEKEYFKLKKTLYLNDSLDTKSSIVVDSAVIANSQTRVNLSDTAVPSYKHLLESDALGINHFRKHIHNVKVCNKKYRRSLKNNDLTTSKQPDIRQTKRKLIGFKPLYERKRTELAMELSKDN